MTTLRMSEPASRHIAEIYRYIARDSVQGAANVVTAIDLAIDLLVRFPEAGHRTLRGNSRMFAVPGYPYLIFYQYLRRLDEVRIRAVRHAARRRTIELREPEQAFRLAVS
jgi:plasmid stabilization system protein ParE